MDNFIEYSTIRDEDQLITLKLDNQNEGMEVFVTLVYAKCSQNERLLLSESLGELANTMQHPWLVGGHYNIIKNKEEKLGGLPITVDETDFFNHRINMCNLEEYVFKGS
ncbi:hypothetical protein FXO38_29333 [Capsicum annuum]|nr:hypothetical protein FXO38_29333 [Capsicum annuum]KAF3668414.1 hypothetical protein FXO37_09567 [Capsicum annuum]